MSSLLIVSEGLSFNFFPNQSITSENLTLTGKDFSITFSSFDQFPPESKTKDVNAIVALLGKYTDQLSSIGVVLSIQNNGESFVLANATQIKFLWDEDKKVGPLKILSTEGTLSLGTTTPWELAFTRNNNGVIAELEFLHNSQLEINDLKITASGIVVSANASIVASEAQKSNIANGIKTSFGSSLKSVTVDEIKLTIENDQCHASIKLRFQLAYFQGADGTLDLLASGTIKDGNVSWIYHAQTSLSTHNKWTDPQGWCSFENMSLLVQFDGEMPVVKIGGKVNFLPDRMSSMVGSAREWVGEFFNGLSADFESDFGGISFPGFDVKPYRPFSISAMGIFKLQIPTVHFDIADITAPKLNFKRLSLSLDVASCSLSGVLPNLTLDLLKSEFVFEGSSKFFVDLSMSAPSGFKAHGRMTELDNVNLKGLEGEGQLSTPTLPGVGISFRIARYRISENAPWIPTIFLYGHEAVCIPLFTGVIIREIGLGAGINCAIDGVMNLTLAQAKLRINQGLPDVGVPASWVPGPTDLTLVGQLYIAATKGPSNIPDLYVADATVIMTSDLQITAFGKIWPMTSIDDAKTASFQKNPCAAAIMMFDAHEPSLRIVAQTNENGLMSPGAGGIVGKLLGNMPSVRMAFECTPSSTAIVLGPDHFDGKLGPLDVSGTSLLAFRSAAGQVYAISRFSMRAAFSQSASAGIGPISLSASLRFGFSTEMLLVGRYQENSLLVYGRSSMVAYVAINLHASIGFSARINCGFFKITISWSVDYDFNLEVHVDLELEIALRSADGNVGLVGSANVVVSVLGITASLHVPVETNRELISLGQAMHTAVESDIQILVGA
jgi:hypothetical protein